jgi:hypothetical protein
VASTRVPARNGRQRAFRGCNLVSVVSIVRKKGDGSAIPASSIRLWPRLDEFHALVESTHCGLDSGRFAKSQMKPDDILANADRLTSDARFLHEAGRSRSAATLIVAALEQMGSFVEEVTREKYSDAVVHMGIFGGRPNAHGMRQDALAAHVLNAVMGNLTNEFCWEIFLDRTNGCGDSARFLQWLMKSVPIEFREDQKQRMKDSPELKAASLLMHLVRRGHLQKLREYGLYENSRFRFSPESVQKIIGLAEKVREVLVRSRELVTPEPIGLAGVNMPENQILELPLKTA